MVYLCIAGSLLKKEGSWNVTWPKRYVVHRSGLLHVYEHEGASKFEQMEVRGALIAGCDSGIPGVCIDSNFFSSFCYIYIYIYIYKHNINSHYVKYLVLFMISIYSPNIYKLYILYLICFYLFFCFSFYLRHMHSQ